MYCRTLSSKPSKTGDVEENSDVPNQNASKGCAGSLCRYAGRYCARAEPSEGEGVTGNQEGEKREGERRCPKEVQGDKQPAGRKQKPNASSLRTKVKQQGAGGGEACRLA